MAEIGYVGSRGRQLVTLVDVNQAPAQLGVSNPNVNRPFFAVNPTLASVSQSQSRGTLDYHALLTRLIRRFSDGLSLSASYTFGKAIDLSSDTDGAATFPNSYDLAYNRGPSNYDVGHVFTMTGVYTLPFARPQTRRLAVEWFAPCALGISFHGVSEPGSDIDHHLRRPRPGLSTRPDRIGPG
jgi:hypothetical protein